MRNYFTYFTEIEEYFIRKRGKNLLISPLDWCLIEVWKDQGIPLHVVLRGIDRSFETAERRQKRSPKTLFYCHPAVVEAFDDYQEAMVGKGELEESGDPEQSSINREEVESHLVHLLQHLEQYRKEEPVRQALRQLSDLRKEVAGRSKTDLRDVDQALSRIGSSLADRLLEEMDPQEAKELRREVRKEVRIYKKRLAPETFERLRQNYLQRRVREHFDLPEFSLLELQS